MADLGGAQGVVQDLATDGSALYVVGIQETLTAPINNQWRIEKRSLPDGALVASFGSGGVITSNPSSANDVAYAIAIDGTWMYVAGTQEDPAVSGQVIWRIEKRSLATGAPDMAFGTNGVVLIDPSARGDAPFDLAVGGGFIYVVGTDYTVGLGDSRWRIDKISAATGLPDSGFGLSGSVFVDPTLGWDTPRGIAIDSTFLYVVGDEDAGAMRIEKRFLSDGSPDTGFGASGSISFAPSSFFNWLDDVVIDGTYLYVAGLADDSVTGPGDWRIYVEKRLLSSGALVSGFGSGGTKVVNPTSAEDYTRSLVLDGSMIYVLGTDKVPGNAQWRIDKWSTVDASPDPTFGAGGVLNSNPSSASFEEVNAGVLVGANLYLGGADYGFGARWRLERHAK